MNWTDATTYSRNDPDKKQSAWELRTGELRIYITNAHRYYPGAWAVVCYEIGINSAAEMKIPGNSTPEKAQKTALAIVKNRIQKMLNSLEQ